MKPKTYHLGRREGLRIAMSKHLSVNSGEPGFGVITFSYQP
jgi:hypothetical protein